MIDNEKQAKIFIFNLMFNSSINESDTKLHHMFSIDLTDQFQSIRSLLINCIVYNRYVSNYFNDLFIEINIMYFNLLTHIIKIYILINIFLHIIYIYILLLLISYYIIFIN